MTQDSLNTRGPNDRITINGQCYFVDELYQWVLSDRNPGYNLARVTLPHDRSIIKRSDLERLIAAHVNLPPVSPVLLASARQRCDPAPPAPIHIYNAGDPIIYAGNNGEIVHVLGPNEYFIRYYIAAADNARVIRQVNAEQIRPI